MVMHWFRKPAGASPYRFEPCTLRLWFTSGSLPGIILVWNLKDFLAKLQKILNNEQ